MKRLRWWLGGLLARLAGWLKKGESEQAHHTGLLSPEVRSGAARFMVARWVKDAHWVDFDSYDGTRARKRFEELQVEGVEGRAEFWMESHNGRQVRGTYERIV